MLELARTILGPMAPHVRLHEGYIDSAPKGPFDGATCLLTAFPAASRAPGDAAANVPATQARCALVVAHHSIPGRSRSGQMALAQCGVRGYFRRTSASSRRQHRGDQGTAARAFARAGCRSAPRGWIRGHLPFLLRVHLQGLGRPSSMRGVLTMQDIGSAGALPVCSEETLSRAPGTGRGCPAGLPRTMPKAPPTDSRATAVICAVR